VADFGAISPLGMKWEAEILPRYKTLVANWETRVEEASMPELIHMIDELADVIGEYLDSITFVGGFAWKVEGVLAKFYRKHAYDRVGRSPQDPVIGLRTPFPEPPPHAVQSLDWFRPPLGKVAQDPESREVVASRRRRMEADRLSMEAACRNALTGSPKLLHRFEELLALAHHYAVVREEQIGWFTLPWPVMRRGVLRLGQHLQRLGTITREEDVFFITRSELDAARQGTIIDLRGEVASRQKDWEWQRRLTPPLSIGSSEAMNHIIGSVAEAMRTPGADGADVLRGMPASPGRASGRVRIVRGPEDFGGFQSGEVLVAQSTAPAWTPLFGQASAVVTDGGKIAAHASLVAREYGIPAVVGTGDATRRLVPGQVVTVDGSAGIVEFLG
jgi:rifampicin phosphotransferase